MSILFISDLHLEDAEPERTRWLLGFIAGPARRADSLYILGDLFEYWIGDDAMSATARHVAEALAGLAGSGVDCHFLHGNRDFMLGRAYAGMAGLELLPEQLVVDLYGRQTLLMHGDELCTDDVEYQAFRRQARDPNWQAAALALPVEERIRMAQNARDASMAHTATASMEIMDVNHDAVLAAFRAYGVDRMIHGHTHRPAFHRHDLGGGAEAERVVLSDWYQAGSYLEVSPEGIESRDL